MPSITVERTIHASPEEVFAAATDVPRWPVVVPAIERVELLTQGRKLDESCAQDLDAIRAHVGASCARGAWPSAPARAAEGRTVPLARLVLGFLAPQDPIGGTV